MSYSVNLFFRKSQKGFYSIETVFNNIIPFVQEAYDVRHIELPESGHSYSALKKNLKYVYNNRADVNHITGHVNYIALVLGRNSILTIHDMISALQGNPIKKFLILCFWFWLPALFVKRITVISNQTKEEVCKYIPFAKSKVVVIQNPISQKYSYQPKSVCGDIPHILCIGTKSNKNLDKTFKALSGISCKLTIIGKLDKDKQQQLIKYKIPYKNLVDISNAEVIQAYENCDVLCFASLYEGFGMPIIEAQAIGRPVLTSNRGAMKEVAKDSACLVDPLDYASIKAGLEKIINDKAYRDLLIKKGLENSKRFKGDQIAKQYMQVYKDVLNS